LINHKENKNYNIINNCMIDDRITNLTKYSSFSDNHSNDRNNSNSNNDNDNNNNINNPPTTSHPEGHVHTFTPRRKLLIVWTVSISAMFSPLSADIYIPALPTISSSLNVSLSTIRWSMTSYLLCQAIAPSFWGWLADNKGRRGVLVMTFILFIVANAVLARVHVLWLLVVFRGVQSAGSAATIAIGMV